MIIKASVSSGGNPLVTSSCVALFAHECLFPKPDVWDGNEGLFTGSAAWKQQEAVSAVAN